MCFTLLASTRLTHLRTLLAPYLMVGMFRRFLASRLPGLQAFLATSNESSRLTRLYKKGELSVRATLLHFIIYRRLISR